MKRNPLHIYIMHKLTSSPQKPVMHTYHFVGCLSMVLLLCIVMTVYHNGI